jgi:hypothetical protein
VVWEGRSREASPYPDSFSDTKSEPVNAPFLGEMPQYPGNPQKTAPG